MNTNARRVWLGALLLLGVGGALWHVASSRAAAMEQISRSWNTGTYDANATKTALALNGSAHRRILQFRTLEEYETVSQYGRLPNSLTGVDVKWNIAANASGRLILSADLAALFEFFLSTHTEEGLATSLGRIDEYLRGVLPQSAAAEALDILRAYLAYKQGLTRFEPPKDRIFTGNQNEDLIATVADVKAAMNQRVAARRQYLGTDVAEAFFHDDEAYDAYTIKRLEVDNNKSLSAAERESQTAQAEQLLPQERRAQVQQERKEAALNQRVAVLQAQGGNEDTIRTLRAEVYGATEADRLAAVDQQELTWTQRLQSYREAKDHVVSQPALTVDAKAIAIAEMERTRFSPAELREVQVLESIRTQNAQGGKAAPAG